MIRIMFDSDQIDALPRNAMVATYSDLVPNLTQLGQLRDEFPLGIRLIDRGHGDPTGEASIGDFETGALQPKDAPAWYDAKRQQRTAALTVYANRSTMPVVETYLGKNRHPFQWIATLDGTMHIDGHEPGRGPALVQFATAAMLGFHADCSVIWEPNWNPSGASSLLDQVITDMHELRGLLAS